MASDNLEDVSDTEWGGLGPHELTHDGGVDLSIVFAWQQLTFKDLKTFSRNGHLLLLCRYSRKACLRTAFQSLQPQQGPSASALSTPTLSTTTPAGSWAEAFPPKLENAVLQAMKQKIHGQLSIRVDPCGPFSVDQISEPGS